MFMLFVLCVTDINTDSVLGSWILLSWIRTDWIIGTESWLLGAGVVLEDVFPAGPQV